jgi:Cu(I)/Ag(I) efflux system periplasmic protein CusF
MKLNLDVPASLRPVAARRARPCPAPPSWQNCNQPVSTPAAPGHHHFGTTAQGTDMKFRRTALLAAILAATSAFAQMNMGDMKGMPMGQKPEAAARQTHTAAGTVRKADETAGTVTLQHGPVASLNWPAMTMAFKVKDKALWKKLESGKKVEVEFAQQGPDYVVVAVK